MPSVLTPFVDTTVMRRTTNGRLENHSNETSPAVVADRRSITASLRPRQKMLTAVLTYCTHPPVVELVAKIISYSNATHIYV